MQKRRPVDGSGVVLLGGLNYPRSTEKPPEPQPDSVHQLRALRLIASHHVRPALALALAALAYGEPR